MASDILSRYDYYKYCVDKGKLTDEDRAACASALCDELAAALREAREHVERIGELERVNALHEGICNELHALHTIDDDGRF